MFFWFNNPPPNYPLTKTKTLLAAQSRQQQKALHVESSDADGSAKA